MSTLQQKALAARMHSKGYSHSAQANESFFAGCEWESKQESRTFSSCDARNLLKSMGYAWHDGKWSNPILERAIAFDAQQANPSPSTGLPDKTGNFTLPDHQNPVKAKGGASAGIVDGDWDAMFEELRSYFAGCTRDSPIPRTVRYIIEGYLTKQEGHVYWSEATKRMELHEEDGVKAALDEIMAELNATGLYDDRKIKASIAKHCVGREILPMFDELGRKHTTIYLDGLMSAKKLAIEKARADKLAERESFYRKAHTTERLRASNLQAELQACEEKLNNREGVIERVHTLIMAAESEATKGMHECT